MSSLQPLPRALKKTLGWDESGPSSSTASPSQFAFVSDYDSSSESICLVQYPNRKESKPSMRDQPAAPQPAVLQPAATQPAAPPPAAPQPAASVAAQASREVATAPAGVRTAPAQPARASRVVRSRRCAIPWWLKRNHWSTWVLLAGLVFILVAVLMWCVEDYYQATKASDHVRRNEGSWESEAMLVEMPRGRVIEKMFVA